MTSYTAVPKSPRERVLSIGLARGVAVAWIAWLGWAGCAGDDGDVAGGAGAASSARDGGAAGTTQDAGGSCAPDEREHPHDSAPAMHVASPLAPAAYNSDPPSSGPHCPVWGQYASYGADAPLPACNFIHNLEHGAIALLYNCPEGCPELVSALEQLRTDPPADPDCASPRVLLTPYREMEATVAAAAWGYTWTADCLDAAARASLSTFIEDHIGSRGDAPEPTVCQGGSVAP